MINDEVNITQDEVGALPQAISEMRNMRESYDQIAGAAEAYNVGKTQLAQAITSKGVETSPTETYPEMAEKVNAISQETTIYEGADSYGKQIGAGGSLWDLYQVLADMKTRFMGTGDYAALIVCEYYKGYPSLVLQGADAYYTCDGDYYDYASPNHVWHDEDNGKMNRWVVFLYRDDGARLDITNTSISPRSMYIGGHIGTVEYFTNGRLTEIVCGIEETDILDNFLTTGFSQNFNNSCILRNIKNIGSLVCNSNLNVIISSLEENVAFSTTPLSCPNALYVSIGGVKHVNADVVNNYLVYAPSAEIVYIPQIETFNTYVQPINVGGSIKEIHMQNVKQISSVYGIFPDKSRPDLIDIEVGELVDRLLISAWNPTNVLADSNKKSQLIDNIKNHILARVSDRTGLSQLVFRVSTNMYNNIASEQIEWQGETMSLADAFLTKNWLLAGA